MEKHPLEVYSIHICCTFQIVQNSTFFGFSLSSANSVQKCYNIVVPLKKSTADGHYWSISVEARF